MKWLKCNKENFVSVVLVDRLKDKYLINLSPKDYIPENTNDNNEGTNNRPIPDMQYLQKIFFGIPSTYDVKKLLVELQNEYDKSDEVNEFTLNGNKGWLDKSTRIGILNSIAILESIGETTYGMWINDFCYNMNIIDIKYILTEVEKYAMKCSNNTFQHLALIDGMRKRDDILNFDVSEGYPEKLSFEVPIVNE